MSRSRSTGLYIDPMRHTRGMTLFFCIYNFLFIPLFYILVHFAALINKKIRKGLSGRLKLFQQVETALHDLPKGKRVWIHVSSMGEYEQARPVIDLLLSRVPDSIVILTVFSPSAFDHLQIDDPRILLFYLPMDTWNNARRFINLVEPNVAIVVRHDIWPNFQWRMQKSGIPSLLIDASVSDKRYWVYRAFQWPIRTVMSTFSRILTVSANSAERFAMLYPDTSRIEVFGDTRYDRVVDRTLDMSKIQWLLDKDLFIREKTLVLGSTWPSGEKYWLPVIRQSMKSDPQFRVILAPHEVGADHIRQISEELVALEIPFVLFSELTANSDVNDFRVLVVDKIGVLANLYTCGLLAYVGGGFGPGVHNVLEPAAHGCAVLFGPRHDVSVEPQELIDAGGGIVVNDQGTIQSIMNTFQKEPGAIQETGRLAREFINNHTGASAKIAAYVETLLPQK